MDIKRPPNITERGYRYRIPKIYKKSKGLCAVCGRKTIRAATVLKHRKKVKHN